jgi:antitoxin YefM
MSTVNCDEAQQKLEELCERAISTKQPILLHRDGKQDVALISAEELAGYMETAHLLSTPANAKELIEAIERSRKSEGVPMSLEEIRARFDINGTDS